MPTPQWTLTGDVKLVVWDLDDTFWKGTLAEGPIARVAANIELVKQLTDSGIICSICSKNERGAVETELRAMGIWDHFVLPSISFQPKGRPIAELIEVLQLRPVNVVFVDDNPSVLAEVAFACPGIQCVDSPAALAAQLDGPHLGGIPGTGAARLDQYKQLAAKQSERQLHRGDDLEFLRQSEIRIEIDHDVEPHLERVVELINRSNQLNFTKQRITNEADRRSFEQSLGAFGYRAGVVRAWDKYADYGIVGFFLTLATLREYRLEHFVFSCRIMNMGIEQFVYEVINKPGIEIAEPVANRLDSFPVVDWIGFRSGEDVVANLRDTRIVVIGGCDMLQLSTYCSGDSAEFTNRDVGGIIKRLDDPFLLLSDPEAVRTSTLREHVPAFTHEEMIELKAAMVSADAVVVSLYRMMEINYFRSGDGLVFRLDEDAVIQILRSDRGLWFIRNFAYVEFSHEERQNLIRAFLEKLSAHAPDHGRIIVILENLRNLEKYPNEIHLRTLYNDFIVDLCNMLPNVQYLDINKVTDEKWVFDDGFHMSRQGYFELARAVREAVGQTGTF